MVEIDHGFTTEMKYAIAGTFTGGLSSKGLRLLKSDWYNVNQVFPICEDQSEVEGIQTYSSVSDLPEPVDVVIVVHKKDRTTNVVKEAASLDPKPAIWFMPGTDSAESIAICEDNDMNYGRSCLMGHRKLSGITRFFNMHFIHSKIAGMNRIPNQSE
ncbi:MAG: CoA-binding protein [Candidatus Hodarchaeales archaeon]|jgi:predicted CoA-binding protein